MLVMSYNLRFDNPRDGENSWPNRHPAVKKVWEDVNADIIGIQEGMSHQVNTLKNWFHDYECVGLGREKDGTGEQVAVFYKKERFECIDKGHFWLSDTPDVPGSRSFGNDVYRISSWVILYDRLKEKKFIFLNTHLDNESQQARIKGAELICDFLAEQKELDGKIVTGDFNDIPDSEALAIMEKEGDLKDTLKVAGSDLATFHNFSDKSLMRIDYILCSMDLKVSKGKVVKDKPFNIYPSDHYPIYAELKW